MMFGEIYYFKDESLHKQYPHGLYIKDDRILLDPYVKKKVSFNNYPIKSCTYEELRIILVLAANLAAYNRLSLPKHNIWIHPSNKNELILVPVIIAAIAKYTGNLSQEALALIDNRYYGVRGYVKDSEPSFVRNTNKPDHTVKDIETLIGAYLPDYYKQFLSDTNGGKPKNPLINKQFEFMIDNYFLDIDSIISFYKTIESNMKNILPIAIVHGGMICISFREKYYGHILYIRNEDYHNVYENLNIPKVGVVSNNFYEFLINLNEVPENMLKLAQDFVQNKSIICE